MGDIVYHEFHTRKQAQAVKSMLQTKWRGGLAQMSGYEDSVYTQQDLDMAVDQAIRLHVKQWIAAMNMAFRVKNSYQMYEMWRKEMIERYL